MRTSKVWTLFSAGLIACAAPLWAYAQQQPAKDAPPKLEKLEEGEPPATSIQSKSREQHITENRERGGRVSSVEVSKGRNTYYLKPNEQAGTSVPGDAQSNTNRGAQWRVLEFDWRRGQQPRAAAHASGTPPPPETPAPPANNK